ncbi:MAG: phosphate--acyl-ACP acyltransferase, partial [Candidatus Omnitrophica bacterium]|nr:phosphate--acyl-ACP acyltransferase [Candidatus Omnitrophota bacterium]
MRIGLDAMGGDKVPECPIEGAVMATHEYDYKIVLIGDEDKIKSELKKYTYPKEQIEIVHTSQTIEMHEPAAISVRKKRDSSIVIGAELLKEGKIDAFVSAGNTGAVVCAPTLSLRLLPGVDRPG